MNLREQLAAKQRRRCVVPIQVTDPAEDLRVFNGAAHALRLAETRDPAQPGEVEQCQAAMDAADEAVMAHYAQVELQSLPAPDWEAAMAQWTGEDGINWAEGLPALLAVSCVHEDLRDEEYWTETLADGSWSVGDRDQIKRALMHLNLSAADPIVPKG